MAYIINKFERRRSHMKKGLLAFALVLFLSSSVAAATVYETGNDLYRLKGSPVFVAGYVMGVWDAWVALAESSAFTPIPNVPNAVTGRQLADIVMKYLEEHPEERHYTASWIAINAIREAFPK